MSWSPALLLLAACASLAVAGPLRIQPGLNITCDPPTISGSATPVVISWVGAQFCTPDDWVGMWCPAPMDWTKTNPVKFWSVVEAAPNSYREGHGQARFNVENYRGDCVFQYMTGGSEYPSVQGISDRLVNSEPNFPTGVHLAVTGVASEMRITYTSASQTEQVVRFGTVSHSYDSAAAVSSHTYTANDMCGDTASSFGFIDPGWINTAVLQNLVPGTTYYYQVGSSGAMSQEFNFTQPNVPGAHPTKVVAFGDMGNADIYGASQHSWDNNNHGEVAAINTTFGIFNEFQKEDPPTLVLHIGDISYAVGYGAEWDQFMNQIQPIASSFPWMTSIGNHEYDTPNTFVTGTDSGGECGVPYAARFIMPEPANTGAPDAPWYAFAHGCIFFVQMSTEQNFLVGSDQYTYLEQQLASVDRSITPWVVFTGHRPMYSDGNYDTPVGKMLIDNIEPLLSKYNVDVALWGHNHSFQRMCEMTNGTCIKGATKHYVIGMAGYSLSTLSKHPPDYIEFSDDQQWGHTVIYADSSSFRLDFMTNGGTRARDTSVIYR